MKKYLLLLILCVQAGFLTAQKNVVDKIVAIVGEEIILKSDIKMPICKNKGKALYLPLPTTRPSFWKNN